MFTRPCTLFLFVLMCLECALVISFCLPLFCYRLNEVKVEGQVWQAQPSSCMDPSSYLSLMRTRDGQEWLQQESERMLGRIESALKHLVVEVEDLQRVVKMKTEYVAS